MIEENGTLLVRLGHQILDGTPATELDPEEAIPFAQVGVTYLDNCRVAPKTVVA